MAQQHYKNHRKFYAPHHFVFYPVVIALMVFSFIRAQKTTEHHDEWMTIGAMFILIAALSFMMRQHYALGAQNRLVRLEMRLRYYQLTSKKLEALESKLTFAQIAALRFAPDEELLPLIEKTLAENLSPNNIKKSINNWQGDNMRV